VVVVTDPYSRMLGFNDERTAVELRNVGCCHSNELFSVSCLEQKDLQGGKNSSNVKPEIPAWFSKRVQSNPQSFCAVGVRRTV
jgi:hypothetical protein